MRRRLYALGIALLTLGVLRVLVEYGVIWFNAPSRADHPIRGVDVSHHQGAIDWDAVATEPIDFVYVKATEGGDWRDARFVDNFDGAARVGLRRGAYHFFTFCRPADEQAQNFIDTVPVTPGALPVAIDLEFGGNCAEVPTSTELNRELAVFITRIEATYGTRPVLCNACLARTLNSWGTSTSADWT